MIWKDEIKEVYLCFTKSTESLKKWWILPTKNYIVAGYRMYPHNNQGLGWSRLISMSEYDDANYNSIS